MPLQFGEGFNSVDDCLRDGNCPNAFLMDACAGGNVHYIMTAGRIERGFKVNTINCTRFVIVFNEIPLMGLDVFAIVNKQWRL